MIIVEKNSGDINPLTLEQDAGSNPALNWIQTAPGTLEGVDTRRIPKEGLNKSTDSAVDR